MHYLMEIFPIKEQKWLRHVLSYVTFVETPEISSKEIFPMLYERSAAAAFVLSACAAGLSLVSVFIVTEGIIPTLYLLSSPSPVRADILHAADSPS